MRSELPMGDASTGDDTTSSTSSTSGDDTTSTGDDTTSTGDDTTSTGSTAPAPFCGDGTVDPGEQCDDGDDNSDQAACKNDCTAQVCGDGDLGPGEQCDDGNDVDTDECTAACATFTCGDGLIGPGEACDDGNKVDDDTCTNACTLATCGDGIVQDPEDCDEGMTATCDADCTHAVCGDGVHNELAGEPCDDGDDDPTDQCNACTLPVCGDGWKQPGEACDDGNKIDGDGCTKQCGKQMVACQNGADLISVPPNNKIAVCYHPQFCEQDYEILCPFNWHLCGAAEFNARNDGWDHSPARLVLGAIHCRDALEDGAGQFGFKHNLKTDHPDNCVYSSSRAQCPGQFGCDDKDAYALCCAPLPFCGDGKVDAPEEQCDDGNNNDNDDCFSNCMNRYADGTGCG